MPELQIIREAYDRCGISYVVRQSKEGYSYLFLCNTQIRNDFERSDLDWLLRTRSFMEFEPGGKVASY